MKFSIEKHTKIYNDDDGSYLSIHPDDDGLGCIQMSAYYNEKKEITFVFVNEEQAKLFAQELLNYIENLQDQKLS